MKSLLKQGKERFRSLFNRDKENELENVSMSFRKRKSPKNHPEDISRFYSRNRTRYDNGKLK